ncbi:MAG: MFS transporter [Pseudomonadota bacterium]|nr:MFS transporter [Pseudomonadota bacterium]
MNLESKTKGKDQGWVVALVSVGHFYSHFVMLSLPPLFLLIQPELGVTFTALGAIVSAMNVMTAVWQLPSGFVVDRFGAKYILITGVAIMGFSLLLVGLANGYWTLFFLFVVAGIGNSVFHPANFSILSARLENHVFGRAVSIHSFMGYLGWGGASLVMLPLALWTDWRTAVSVIGVIGIGVTAMLLFWSSYLNDKNNLNANEPKTNTKNLSFRENLVLLRSLPLLMMFLFYLITAISTSGVMSFSIVANVSLFGVEKMLASTVLTGYLVASAAGVILGGWLADQTNRHNLVASVAVFFMASFIMLLAFGGGVFFFMLAGMILSGLCYGISSPSRDILTRKASPEGSAGIAFGYTSTGMSIGNFIGPVLCGWILDLGQPRVLFGFLAILVFISIITIVFTRPRHTVL